MVESSSAREQPSTVSPSTLPSAAPHQESTPRNVTTTVALSPPSTADERTPLLAANADGCAEDEEPRSRPSTLLYRLTALSLGCSVAFIAFYIAISIIIEVGPAYYHVPYNVQDGLRVLLTFVRILFLLVLRRFRKLILNRIHRLSLVCSSFR